ncbi:MAG: DUF1538 domain-containing protein [Chloroflexia bacterium]|nr:DUF1538 domain-containing protein [Chloroflexia bacterium]
MTHAHSDAGLPSEVEVSYKVKITPRLVSAILGPYIGGKIAEQVKSLLPITVFLFLFQLVVLREGISDSIQITVGLSGVVLGLMFFMDGIRLGLIPLGQSIGATLPAKAGLWLILGFAFVLGVGATYAEPAIATLRAAGGNIGPADSVLLFEMLNQRPALLVASVAAGVGIATVLGVYRFVRHWSLKLLLLPTIAVALPLTVVAELHPETRDLTALAWDTGAVTTGSVTVPLVLALGVGVSTVLGKSDTGMGGFGIVTLASLWPVITVFIVCLTIFYGGWASTDGPGLTTTADAGAGSGESLAELVAASMRGTLQAIVPLVALLYIVQRFVLKEEIRQGTQILLGIVFALIGLLLFQVGLGWGLIPLGQQVGGNVPSAFALPDQLYGATGGRVVAVVFAFVLGYGATLAEPALKALALTVEEITAGAFKRQLLAQAVAVGVGLGLAAGLAQIIFDWPITYLVIPSYVALAGLTLVSDEKYVNIGWDSAGVTTGEITVPLVLAMGLGVAGAVGVPDGFGMLTMGSIGPILTVLALGLFIVRTTPDPASRHDAVPVMAEG